MFPFLGPICSHRIIQWMLFCSDLTENTWPWVTMRMCSLMLWLIKFPSWGSSSMIVCVHWCCSSNKFPAAKFPSCVSVFHQLRDLQVKWGANLTLITINTSVSSSNNRGENRKIIALNIINLHEHLYIPFFTVIKIDIMNLVNYPLPSKYYSMTYKYFVIKVFVLGECYCYGGGGDLSPDVDHRCWAVN